MIPSSPIAKFAAGVIALAAVGAFVGARFGIEEVRVEGGGEPVSASLGASFADLAAGTAAPADAPRPLAPEPPPPVTRAQPPQAVTQAEPPLVSAATAEIPVTPMNAAPEPPSPAEAIAAAEPEPGVVTRSPRPSVRPEEIETAKRPPPEPEPTRARAGAPQSARAGSETGARDAPAARSGPRAQRTREAGNAAASNYPGEVMQRISRQRKPSVRARGTATVSFQVASSGGLASVGIAGSSGSAALDGEAVRLIQRAAPFPPPPPGARRSFSIQISGR